MLIEKPKIVEEVLKLTELQKMATEYLPIEQVTKFAGFQHLVETELMNEAREPEISNTIKDLFRALHEHNTPKLLKVLQGDKKALFYSFKKQLEMADKLSKQQAKVLAMITDKEVSLLTISLLR